jgi:hypothetical protein
MRNGQARFMLDFIPAHDGTAKGTDMPFGGEALDAQECFQRHLRHDPPRQPDDAEEGRWRIAIMASPSARIASIARSPCVGPFPGRHQAVSTG